MAEGVNVRISGKLRQFVEAQVSPEGLYESTSEYVRDLIRRDYERSEERKWQWLNDQLAPGMEAPDEAFLPFDTEKIIEAAKTEKRKNAS